MREGRSRSRRYSTEVKTMVSSMEMEQRQDGKARRSTEDERVNVKGTLSDQDLDDVISTVLESEVNLLTEETSKNIEDQTDKLADAASVELENAEISKLVEEGIDTAVNEELSKLSQKIDEAVEIALVEEVTNTIEEATSTIEEVIEKAIDEAVSEAIEQVVEHTVNTATSTALLEKFHVKTVTMDILVPKTSVAETFGDDVAKIIKQIPSPLKTREPANECIEGSHPEKEVKARKAKKKDKRSNSETQKPLRDKSQSSKRKSNRVSMDGGSSDSWSCSLNNDEATNQAEETKEAETKQSTFDTQKVSKAKSHSSKRKSKRFSMEVEPSESWSCTIITEEVPNQTEEKSEDPEEKHAHPQEKPAQLEEEHHGPEEMKDDVVPTPLLVHSTLLPVLPPEAEPIPLLPTQPTVVDLTEMSQTETADLQATQAFLEEISLSVLGVRFRCPLCSWTDEQVRCVRDHMSMTHKGSAKAKQKSPVRQGMRVRLKHPRIHKDTLLSAVEYYKSFGGHFFTSETKASIKFWGKEIPKMRDLSGSNKICDTPARKKIGPKSWMIENKLLPPDPIVLETPLRAPPSSRPSLKRRPKPQDLDQPTNDESESLAKIGEEILNNDISQVNLFDEIDIDVQNQLFADADSAETAIDVQNQLFADADSAGLFANEPSSFEENLTGLETLSVDSDFDVNDDIDTSRTRRRKSEALKKVKPIKIKKKITLTKTPKKSDSVWNTVESEQLYQSTEPEPLPTTTEAENFRRGDMADDDDSEIENKVPTLKKKISPKKPKEG